MKALLLIILLNASIGYAANPNPDCQGALFTSSILNPPVQSYVELISHYRKNSTDEDSVSLILNAIINSNHILNPFLNRETDSRFHNALAIQVSLAIDKIIYSITSLEWRTIQSELKSRRSQWDQEETDRGQKANETRAVLRPRLKEGLCGPVTSDASNAQAPLKKGENTYMISIDDDKFPRYKLYLIECVNEKQIIRDEIQLEKKVFGLRWSQAGDRDILLGRSEEGQPVTFELRNQELVEIKMLRAIHQRDQTPFSDLVRSNNRDFLVLGGYNRIILWELVGDHWSPADVRVIFKDEDIDPNRPPYPKHLLKMSVHGHQYFAVFFEPNFIVIELADNKLSLVFESEISNRHLHEMTRPPVALVDENRITFAFTYSSGMTMNPSPEDLKTDYIDFPISGDESPRHRHLTLIEGRNSDFIIAFERDAHGLIRREPLDLKERVVTFSVVEAFEFMGRSFIAYASRAGDFVTLEKIDEIWMEVARLHVRGFISNYKLFIEEDRVYAAIENGRGIYRLIELIYAGNVEHR